MKPAKSPAYESSKRAELIDIALFLGTKARPDRDPEGVLLEIRSAGPGLQRRLEQRRAPRMGKARLVADT